MGLKSAPEEVKRAFAELKQRLGKPISLHRISGKYYVYEYSSVRDQRKGKTVIRTSYLGRLSGEGKFVPKGGLLQAEQGEDAVKPEPARVDNKVDKREAIALRNLSMNGRMSMAKLAKRLGMSTTGARHFVKHLEEKYSIRYFAEVDTLKLGYLRYIALVKFEDRIPKVEEIKKAFEDDPHVALVAMIKGVYDMMIIFYLKNNTSLANFIYDWRSSKALPSYTARWFITPLGMASGITIPLRREFVDNIFEKQLDKVGLDKTTLTMLTDVERLALKEFMIDGAQDFGDVDKKYGLGLGRSNYAFYKLKEKGIIERITLTMKPVGLRYNSLFITETNNYKMFVNSREKWLQNMIAIDKPWINKYAYRGDMGIPDSIFCIRPIFENDELHETLEGTDSIRGTKTQSMIITETVIGCLCYRNFDLTHTKSYERLMKRNKIENDDKIEY